MDSAGLPILLWTRSLYQYENEPKLSVSFIEVLAT